MTREEYREKRHELETTAVLKNIVASVTLMGCSLILIQLVL